MPAFTDGLPTPDRVRRFIHGGAWRDPLITSRSILPALQLLCHHTTDAIAGIASLNYRLAPYPAHPTHPSAAADLDRNARHPAPIHDVRAAVSWLQARHGFGSRYALVGHSCGATLAFQAVMGSWGAEDGDGDPGTEFVRPMAIAGVEGIYDIPKLLATHTHEPVYREFVESAFGPDGETCAAVSPVSGELRETWPEVKFVLLYHSLTDELVEYAQMVKMCDFLISQKVAEGKLEAVEFRQSHDEVWKKGNWLAHAIERLVKLTSIINRG